MVVNNKTNNFNLLNYIVKINHMNNNRNSRRGNTVLNKQKSRFNFIKKHIQNYLNNQNNQNNQIIIDNKEEGNIEWKELIFII